MNRKNLMKKDLTGYWKKNLSLLITLLSVWAIVSFGLSILLVEPMNAFRIAGFPVGFWFAQQGAIYVFVVLIFVYYFRMQKIDEEFDVQE
jgi:putative solute:sodium symporter small subunit